MERPRGSGAGVSPRPTSAPMSYHDTRYGMVHSTLHDTHHDTRRAFATGRFAGVHDTRYGTQHDTLHDTHHGIYI